MTRQRLGLVALLFSLALVFLGGCPPPPVLQVTPSALTFGTDAETAEFVIANAGGGNLDWELEEVVLDSETDEYVAQEIDWLSSDVPSGSTGSESSRVVLSADREQLAVGVTPDAGLRITSNGGEIVLPVSLEVEPTLLVNPSTVYLSEGVTSGEFNVVNVGGQRISWTVRYLESATSTNNPQTIPEDMTVSPESGSTPPKDATTVSVEWSVEREELNFLVESDAGSGVVTFVFGAALEGLELDPGDLTLFVNAADIALEGEASEAESLAPTIEQPPSILTIQNIGAIDRTWSIEVRDRQGLSEVPPVAARPSSGTAAAGGDAVEVEVFVTAPSAVAEGSGIYELVVSSGGRFLVVPITIEIVSLPVIAISEPPQEDASRPEITPLERLDFGRDTTQMTFWIANTGPRDSDLYFRITYAEQEDRGALIADISPLEGDTTSQDPDFFYPPDSNNLIDGQAIVVTVNRDNMTEDAEVRTVTIEAMDQDGEEVLTAVEAQTIRVFVERPPLGIEGAINRSRPTYSMRFVFLLRDTLGHVIQTLTAEDRERITFSVDENGAALDLDETSVFVNGPENFRGNVAILLDFTGSMYYAGVDDISDPMRPGAALDDVLEATKLFIGDLPENYNIALMYHNDRQQRQFMIHPFTSDREALTEALDGFSLPPAQFGVSNIRDAVVSAVAVVAAEDPVATTLPYDDADFRSVVFISDGRDNASIMELNQVTDYARENKVRLYPLGYGPNEQINMADLIVMADETGGHFYDAGDARRLPALLANQEGLSLETLEAEGQNRVFFSVVNESESALNWEATGVDDYDWMVSVSPSRGSLPAGSQSSLTVTLDPAGAPAGQIVEGKITVSAESGRQQGSAVIQATTNATGTAFDALGLSLRDETGIVWDEFRNQIMLTYITPSQDGGTYDIEASYERDDGRVIKGSFQEDGVFTSGDIYAGQISLKTEGLSMDPDTGDVLAEVAVYADYAPRDVDRIRVRFYLEAPEDIPGDALTAFEALSLDDNLLVELAGDGLLVAEDEFDVSWRLLSNGDGVYDVLTERANALTYGAFGNLLALSLVGLGDYVAAFDDTSRDPELFLHMRVENEIYYAPGAPGYPSETKYFLYPGGPLFLDRGAFLTVTSDLAPPARTLNELVYPGIDPEATGGVWDLDEDGVADFQDPYPDNEALPGTLSAPNPYQINDDEDEVVLLVRNNRLDTFQFSVSHSGEASWLGAVSYDYTNAASDDGTLRPGESALALVAVRRSGLLDGYYESELTIETDTFGVENVNVTLVVISDE